MRDSNALAAEALAYAGSLAAPGVTTDEIDKKVHDFIVARGAYPSPLLYAGFPKSICTSVNEVLCHGIPDTYVVVFACARLAYVTYVCKCIYMCV
jgi:methionyl aminopeptidase